MRPRRPPRATNQQKRSHTACLVSDTARNMSTKAHAADVAMPAQVLNDSVVERRRRGWPLSEALSASTNPCKPTALLSTQLSPALLCSSLLDCAEVPFVPQQSVAKQSWNVLREATSTLPNLAEWWCLPTTFQNKLRNLRVPAVLFKAHGSGEGALIYTIDKSGLGRLYCFCCFSRKSKALHPPPGELPQA